MQKKLHRNDRNLKIIYYSVSADTNIQLATISLKTLSFQIEIALLPGQGGTPADGEFLRSKGNNWNIQEAAAQSGFILYSYVKCIHRFI